MDKNNYNPENIVMYHMYQHGKDLINIIYNAIKQADLNKDIPYMLYFREELCEESRWYSDGLDTILVYPEILGLIDKYPNIERVHFQRYEKDAIEPALWIYETFLETCTGFYNIPLEDCKKYLADFRKRWLEYGYSEREPYRMELEFCLETGNMDKAAEIWDKLKEIKIESYDRKGAYINTKIKYYLLNNKKVKADGLADRDILRGQVNGSPIYFLVIRQVINYYLEYYIRHGNYKNAAEIAYKLEHYFDGGYRPGECNAEKETTRWASVMCAYVYNRPGQGLRIYKKHWKEWEEEKNPLYKFYEFKNAACFFKGIKNERDVVKFKPGNLFPLYNESNIYNTSSLCSYYYKGAEEIAKKFDKRNGTDKFTKELEKSFANACLDRLVKEDFNV